MASIYSNGFHPTHRRRRFDLWAALFVGVCAFLFGAGFGAAWTLLRIFDL